MLVLVQEKEVAPVIAEYWEKAEFPHSLVPSFAKLGLAGGSIKGYGCPVGWFTCRLIQHACMSPHASAVIDNSLTTHVTKSHT